MQSVSLVLVGVVAGAGCGKKAVEPRYDGPMPVTFGDCAGPATGWVSGPRPAAFTQGEAEDVWIAGDAVTAQAPVPAKPAENPDDDSAPPPEEDESGGTGTAMALDEGKMGKQNSDRAEGQYRMRRNEDPALARQQAIEQARNAGIIGTRTIDQGGAFAALQGTADLGSGFDDSNIYGSLLGGPIGEMSGGYGFALGPGEGGTGWGTIGTGRYGTIGHGQGISYGVGRPARPAPTVEIGQPNAQGDLDKAIIRRYIKRNIPRITYCYEKELLAKPGLRGTVMTQFFIAPSGEVASATSSGVDPAVASCLARVIKAIQFPKPKGSGGVQVNYPFTFRPAGDAPSSDSGSAVAEAGSGGSADAGSAGGSGGTSAENVVVSKPPPSANAKRRLYRAHGDHDPDYKTGRRNPLRDEDRALSECFRRTPKHWGTAPSVVSASATPVRRHPPA
jgi:hypothetical protein